MPSVGPEEPCQRSEMMAASDQALRTQMEGSIIAHSPFGTGIILY